MFPPEWECHDQAPSTRTANEYALIKRVAAVVWGPHGRWLIDGVGPCAASAVVPAEPRPERRIELTRCARGSSGMAHRPVGVAQRGVQSRPVVAGGPVRTTREGRRVCQR